MSSNKKIQSLIRKLMLEGYGENNSPNYFHAALIATDPSAAEIIRLSKNDRSKRVRDTAIHQLHEGGITESRRLAHRILREIKRRGHVAN